MANPIPLDPPVIQDYLVIYDNGAKTAYVNFSNPLGSTSSGPIALDDDADIAASAETLLALVATKKGLTRPTVVQQGAP